MPLDPQAQAYLERIATGAPRPDTPGPEVAKVEDQNIPGPAGALPVRIYIPEGEAPHPVLIWLHGGGWVRGSVETTDATCRALTNEAGCIVVSVDYRLAPATKFPGPIEDCYAAAVWTVERGRSFGADPTRVAIGGASAGGNLAAATTLVARDRGGPTLLYQLLVYPVTDQAMDSPSFEENGEGYGLTRDSMIESRELYLRSDADRTHPYAAPLRVGDLSGLPPALVITAEFDPLRDQGEAYARKLAESGVPTRCSRYDGMIHMFFNPAMGFDKSFEAIAEAGAALRGAFEG